MDAGDTPQGRHTGPPICGPAGVRPLRNGGVDWAHTQVRPCLGQAGKELLLGGFQALGQGLNVLQGGVVGEADA